MLLNICLKPMSIGMVYLTMSSVGMDRSIKGLINSPYYLNVFQRRALFSNQMASMYCDNNGIGLRS